MFLLKRSFLCNCDIHAEEHFLLESIAACPGKQSDMTIYYTVNTTFMHYLDNFKEQLENIKLRCESELDNTGTNPSNLQQQHCTTQWYAIAALTLMIVLLIIYICLNMQRCTIFKRRLYSNTVTIMLFFSDIKQYIPVKLCKSAGSIHLFQIYGHLNSDQIVLEKKCLWDVIRIDWKEVL